MTLSTDNMNIMEDQFKTPRKSIVPEVKIGPWVFGPREVKLIILLGVLLFISLLLMGLYISEKKNNANDLSASAAMKKNYCTGKECMNTASWAMSLRNTSVDPCENFYQYACGRYKETIDPLTFEGTITVMMNMEDKSNNRIIEILEQPISAEHDWAAEKKLKQFFQSCNDMFLREKRRGLPLVNEVIPDLGGWNVLGTMEADSWDLNSALEKLHANYFTFPFFRPFVEKNIISGGSALSVAPSRFGRYINRVWFDTKSSIYREDYKKFIRKVGHLLVEDASIPHSASVPGLLDQFVDDVDTMLAKITSFTSQDTTFHQSYEKLTLDSLTKQTNNVIDYTRLLSHYFDKATMSGSSEVLVLDLPFFTGMSKYLASLSKEEMKRKVNNYVIWRVAEHYLQDLSWDYVHADREVYVDINGEANFDDTYVQCFRRLQLYMPEVINHLFIKQFLSQEKKDKAHEINLSIKEALKNQVSQTPWMDNPTRKYAEEKVDKITIKTAFSDWLADEVKLNNIFSSLTVNVSDYFGNIGKLSLLNRDKLNTQLKSQDTGMDHRFMVSSVTIFPRFNSHEIHVPAGALQFPMYHANQSHFSSFGALGSYVGKYLHYYVDEHSKSYDKNGQLMGLSNGPTTWWSKSSLTGYSKMKQCVENVKANDADRPKTVVKFFGSDTVPEIISQASGIRLALIGYKNWMKTNNLQKEKMIPGIDLTNKQMLFLSYAQVNCQAYKTPTSKQYSGFISNLNREPYVNTILGQLEEFSEAFQCKPEAAMNHKTKCQYY